MPQPISLFRYFGAKNSQVKNKIFSSPRHKIICEPFAGSGAYAVFFSCQSHEIILNELDPEVHAMHKLIFEQTDYFESLGVPANKAEFDAITDIGYKRWIRTFFNFSGATNREFPAPDTITYQTYFSKPNGELIIYKSGKKNTREYVGRQYLIYPKKKIIDMVKVIKENCTITLLNMDGAQLIKDNKDKLWTWFIDPPYKNKNGDEYGVENTLDYTSLADDILSLTGHKIVTEQEGATWLDFRHVLEVRSAKVMGDTVKSHNLVVFEQ